MDSDLQQWLDDNSRKRPRKWRKLLIERRRRVMLSLMLIIIGTTIEQRRLWSKPRSDGFLEYCDEYLHRHRLERKLPNEQVDIPVHLSEASRDNNLEAGNQCGISYDWTFIWSGRSTACTITHDMCSAIVKVFGKSVISFPKDNALRDVIDGLDNKFIFPQCAGAIDGTHIPILAPREYTADYYNQKGWHSVIQAVCYHLYRFTDLTFGWPGRVHDARVFANSIIFMKGQEGSFFPHVIIKKTVDYASNLMLVIAPWSAVV